MNIPNTEEFDKLEEALDERGISIETLLSTYRDFLEKLVCSGKFVTIPSASLSYILGRLKEPAALLIEKEEERREIRNHLWALADENRDANPDLYNLARCAIIIYGKMEDWDTAQDSPVFYFLFHLRKILPNIESEFITHFKKSLLS
ncbi:MAG TPA: hypothetical protein VN280_19885 [Variovorax sp.]|nr:hypothetical protein [Variovorax sp.]